MAMTGLTATELTQEQAWRQVLVYSGDAGNPVGSHASSLTAWILMPVTSMGGRAAASGMAMVAGQTKANDQIALIKVHERKQEGERQLGTG